MAFFVCVIIGDMNFRLASITLFVLILILILHLFGMYEHLYISYWYYDIILHILGGVGIALSALFILKNPRYIILITIVAGILWELFEAYYGITGAPVGSYSHKIDTVKDLVDDTLGALVVYLISKNK